MKDAEVEDFLGQLLQNTDLTYEVENEVIIIQAGKTTAGLPGECTGGQRKGDR